LIEEFGFSLRVNEMMSVMLVRDTYKLDDVRSTAIRTYHTSKKIRSRVSEALRVTSNFGSVNLFNMCNYYDYLILIVVIISCEYFGLVNLCNTCNCCYYLILIAVIISCDYFDSVNLFNT
jgi:hypothetical protein